MSDAFANTALTSLVFDVLLEIDGALVPPDFRRPDEFAKAAHLADEKGTLLWYAYERGGARPLLAVGRALSRAKDMPVLQVLLNSQSPSIIAEKWTRLEEYHHSSHRTRIENTDDTAWSCARYSTKGVSPSIPFNCLIFGLQMGLLRLYGCEEVVGHADNLTDLGDEDLRQVVYPASLDQWGISWKSKPPVSNKTSPLEPDEPLLKRLSQILVEDLGRVWRLKTASHALAQSPRTLQRNLAELGHTFSSVLRTARTAQAGRLLRQTDWSLSDIGYACGYADQAHFQRDFRRAVNMTPKKFRDMSNIQA